MDGATVAISSREGLPDDVIERLQRKVMEQARELSALRKSEAAAQAELDRALLGSPGRARSPSPDRALRRRLADVEARLDAEKRAAADARARATRAEAQLARKTPGDLRKKLADAEAALKSAAAASKSREEDQAAACAKAAADAKRACHGRLDALEGRVTEAIAAGAAKERAAAEAGAAAADAAAAAFGALRAEGDAALRDLRAAAEEAVGRAVAGRAEDRAEVQRATDRAEAASAAASAINANAARLQMAADQVDRACLNPLRSLEEAARREDGTGTPDTYAKVLEVAGLRAVGARMRSLGTERDAARKAVEAATDAAEAARADAEAARAEVDAARAATAAAARRADEGRSTHDAVARALANVIATRDAPPPPPPPPPLPTVDTTAIAARAVLTAALDHALPAVARVSSDSFDTAPAIGDEPLDALARRASACLHAAAVALAPAPAPVRALAPARRGTPVAHELDDASLDDGAADAEDDALAELGLGARYLVWANSRRGDAGLVYPAYAPPSPQRSARPSSGRLARARAHLARLRTR